MTPTSAGVDRSPRQIFLSDTIASHDQQRGVARYFRKIAEATVAAFGDDVVICSPHKAAVGRERRVSSPVFRGSAWLGIHDITASITAYRERPVLFYSPYYGNARTRAPQVFTVYDMIHERFPQYFSARNWFTRRFIAEKRRCLERASLLLAISDCTARDIVACYPHIDPAKIVTTPLGVDEYFFAGAQQTVEPCRRPYFLYVGHRTFYKNFARLLAAFGESGLASAFDLRIISPTGSAFTPQEQAMIQTYGLQDRIHLITAATEATLRASYAAAVALVYPSEYEGFGLPILEALASGTIVATSAAGSMPEAGGDVALYFDPYDTASIARCLQHVATLPTGEREKRIAHGIVHARSFTWTRCQEQTIAAFRQCMVQ